MTLGLSAYLQADGGGVSSCLGDRCKSSSYSVFNVFDGSTIAYNRAVSGQTHAMYAHVL